MVLKFSNGSKRIGSNHNVDPDQTAFLVTEFSGTRIFRHHLSSILSGRLTIQSETVSLMNDNASCFPLPSSLTAAVTVGLWSV